MGVSAAGLAAARYAGEMAGVGGGPRVTVRMRTPLPSVGVGAGVQAAGLVAARGGLVGLAGAAAGPRVTVGVRTPLLLPGVGEGGGGEGELAAAPAAVVAAAVVADGGADAAVGVFADDVLAGWSTDGEGLGC